MLFGAVAQSVEQRPFKPWAEGSSPSRLTMFSTTYGSPSVSQSPTFAPCSARFVTRLVPVSVPVGLEAGMWELCFEISRQLLGPIGWIPIGWFGVAIVLVTRSFRAVQAEGARSPGLSAPTEEVLPRGRARGPRARLGRGIGSDASGVSKQKEPPGLLE